MATYKRISDKAMVRRQADYTKQDATIVGAPTKADREKSRKAKTAKAADAAIRGPQDKRLQAAAKAAYGKKKERRIKI